jgi:opacity protein-like surface antigen
LVLRYGFLKDQEVPFGRLQPFVSVGPGFVVIYGQADSAKNFSLEASTGVRYMFLKNVSAYLEYQFSYQWEVELESQTVFTTGGPKGGMATFDYETHRVVAGVAYHF